jgi:hypothetical protein
MFTKLKNLAMIAREQRAAQADSRRGEEEVPAIRCALVKWAGDDYIRGRREANRNKAARVAAKAKRAAQAAAHLWDYKL